MSKLEDQAKEIENLKRQQRAAAVDRLRALMARGAKSKSGWSYDGRCGALHKRDI